MLHAFQGARHPGRHRRARREHRDRADEVCGGGDHRQLGPQQIVAALSAEFEDALTTEAIERCVKRIEDAIRSKHPDVAVLFVKPQTEETWLRRSESIGRRSDEKPD